MSTVVITGANRGIGLEICRQMAARGDRVIAVCREASEELSALADVQVETGVDVTSDDAVAELASRLDGVTIDILVNNAGIGKNQDLDNIDWEDMRKLFEVNSLGPLRVTLALLPKIAKGGKVAMVTSRMGSIADNTSGGSYGYRMSKAALNMAGVSLAQDLADRAIAVALLHPGWVRTDMTGGSGHVGADESAAGLIARIDELDLGNSGHFWHMNGDELPW